MTKGTEKIDAAVIKAARKKAEAIGGKSALARVCKISYPTLLSLLNTGKARPDISAKLASGLGLDAPGAKENLS